MSDAHAVKTDEDGIPILEDAVPAEALGAAPPAAVDLSDRAQVEGLLHTAAVQTLVKDLADDLQRAITWRIEALLKEEMHKLIHEATQRSVPQLLKEIQTQLALALPDLLAGIARASRR